MRKWRQQEKCGCLGSVKLGNVLEGMEERILFILAKKTMNLNVDERDQKRERVEIEEKEGN